jgi:hypothetical protein
MRKLLLGTAIAMVLATASYAQTYTADDAAQAAKSLADVPNPDDLLNGVPATPDGRFADAWDMYNLVANYECRDQTVELVILALTEDLEWIGNYLDNGDGPVLTASSSRPKAKTEYDGIKIFLTILKDKPACQTPATATPAIPGPGSTPAQQPPRVDVPQQPEDPNEDPEPPGTCMTTANAVIGLLGLKLDPGTVLQQTPPPRWKQQTIGDKCVWYLKYYTINDRREGGWNIMYTDVPCTDPPPGSSAHQAAGSDGGGGAQYCPPSSTGLNLPNGDGTHSQLGRSTPGDPNNSVEIAAPLQPLWVRSLTPPGASDQLLNGRPDSDRDPVLSDPKTAKPSDDKTSEKSNPNGDGEKVDSKSAGKTDKSDAKSNSNGEHANAKSASTSERASTKAESNNEHAMRSGAHEKADVYQHVTHANGAGHTSGMHDAGMHKEGMGGTHAGRLGGLHGSGLGGLGGLLLGGLGRL